MKDSYSFDVTDEGLEASYQNQRQAYVKIFSRLGLEYVIVQAQSGARITSYNVCYTKLLRVPMWC